MSIIIGPDPRWREAKDPLDNGVVYPMDVRAIVAETSSSVAAVVWTTSPSTSPPLSTVAQAHSPDGLLYWIPGGGVADTDYTCSAIVTLANGRQFKRSARLLVRAR